MNTEEMLESIRRHTIERVFQMMTVVVNSPKRQNQLKKFAPNLKSVLARPPIYDRAYPKMLSTASPGNPIGITKPSSLLLFVQLHKNCLEESTKAKETYFLTIFSKRFIRKIRSQSKLASQVTAVHIV